MKMGREGSRWSELAHLTTRCDYTGTLGQQTPGLLDIRWVKSLARGR
jgi:hypothetical protein